MRPPTGAFGTGAPAYAHSGGASECVALLRSDVTGSLWLCRGYRFIDVDSTLFWQTESPERRPHRNFSQERRILAGRLSEKQLFYPAQGWPWAHIIVVAASRAGIFRP
jgi:hypothetical protein